MTNEEVSNKHLHGDKRIKKKFEEITKKSSLLYMRNGSKTIKIDGETYPLYKIDENGLPLKYSKKEFSNRVKTDVELIAEAFYVVKMISQGLALSKAGVSPDDNELSLSGTSRYVSGDYSIAINKHTATRIRDFIQKRMQEYPKIYATTGTGTGHNKVKKASLTVFSKEWVTFLREAAKERMLGTTDGTAASGDTDEDDLLFPSTEEGQKEKMPYLFGYGKGFKDLCVVPSQYMIRFLHYFFDVNNCKNADPNGKGYFRTEVDGKKVKINDTTFKLPKLMTKTLKNFLKEVQEKSNKSAQEQDDDEKRTKQYYSEKYFAMSLIFTAAKAGSSEDATQGKEKYKGMKDGEDGDKLLNKVVKEQELVTEGFDAAGKLREANRKEEAKAKPKKNSTRKSKTRAEEREENLAREN